MNITPGARVQIAPHYDLWMRGARFGTVTRVINNALGGHTALVRMDHPEVKKLQRIPTVDLKYAF